MVMQYSTTDLLLCPLALGPLGILILVFHLIQASTAFLSFIIVHTCKSVTVSMSFYLRTRNKGNLQKTLLF